MHKTRSELREIIVIILYQIDIYESNNIPYYIDSIIRENIEIENRFVREIVYGVENHIDEIDTIADNYLTNWSIKRIDKMGASILRMAFYELMYTDTPRIVIINEAIELAKKYSDDSVRKMINASLDNYVKEHE